MILALKLLLVPLLLGAASAVARRFGPGAGGWVTALPLVAAPIVLIMTLEHGDAFGARAARGTLLGLVFVAGFCVAYARLAARGAGWAASLAASWAVVAVLTPALSWVDLSAPGCFALVLATLAGAHAALPGAGARVLSRVGWAEIGWRLVAGVAMVLATTALAGWMGPRLGGLAACFPIGVTVMAVFSHRFHGRDAVVQLLRGVVPGLASFAVFFLVLALVLPRSTVWPAFGLATAASLAVHGVLVSWLRRRARRAARRDGRRAAPGPVIPPRGP